MQALKCKYFIRYTFLMIYFRKYVKDFRKRRYLRNRVTAVSSIVKMSLIEKMHLSLQKLKKKTAKV